MSVSPMEKLQKDVKDLQNDLKELRKQVVIVGTIVPYGGESEPGDGWLLCDGRALERGEYPDLYKVIATNFGAPDATRFNLPDLRGRFVRGVDHDSKKDPDAKDRKESVPGGNVGDKVGSVQEDALKGHNHSYKTNTWFFNEGKSGIKFIRGDHTTDSQHPDETSFSGGNETRPKNIYVNWIIYAGV